MWSCTRAARWWVFRICPSWLYRHQHAYPDGDTRHKRGASCVYRPNPPSVMVTQLHIYLCPDQDSEPCCISISSPTLPSRWNLFWHSAITCLALLQIQNTLFQAHESNRWMPYAQQSFSSFRHKTFQSNMCPGGWLMRNVMIHLLTSKINRAGLICVYGDDVN